MVCEFAYKYKDGTIKCMYNLIRGLVNGKPNNVISSDCIENTECYYKLWKRALRHIEIIETGAENAAK